MQFIKADTNTEVLVGPVVAVGDGFTPVTTLSLSTADEAELIKYGGATALTVTSISANTMSAITGADGYYTLDLSTSNTDTEGFLTVLINDDSLCLPVRMDFMVVNANVYDSLFAAATTDYLQVDVAQWLGTAAATPTTAGVPEVDVTFWAGNATTYSAAAGPDVNVQAIDNIDFGATMKASINTEVDSAIETYGLQYLVNTALPTGWSTDVTANSALDYMADDGTAVYDRTTDSLQAIADSGGGGPTAAQIADAVWDEDLSTGHAIANSAAVRLSDTLVDTSTTLPATLTTIDTVVDGIQTDLDNATDGLGAIKTAVDAIPTSNPSAASIASAVWDETLTSHVTADSSGVHLKDIIADTNELQTDDYPTTLATLATAAALATVDTNVDSILTNTTNIETDTQDIQFRLPAALVSGKMDSDMTAISGDTAAADNLEASTETLVAGSVSAGSHTTALIAASNVTGHGDDTFIGRVVIFRTGTLQYEAGAITDYTSTTGALTFAASTWTTAPSSGDTFVIV